MSFFKKIITSQLIDVIEWTDSSANTMVYRYERDGKEIMMGAQLTVRESQVAVFVNEGKIADIFQPGRYELSTQNMPIMTALKSWKYGFKSPSRRKSTLSTPSSSWTEVGHLKPGHDARQRVWHGAPARLRHLLLPRERPGGLSQGGLCTTELMTVEGVEGQIKRTVVSALSDIIAQSKIPALDLAANYDELSQFALSSLSPRLPGWGSSWKAL